MSIVELSDHGPRSAPIDDRVPPQDVEAEQSVLGSMLLSKDAIADCVEGLRGADFYRPAHETIYEAILELYGRGEPADTITLADELAKRGDLQRVGGQAYLHQLVQVVPTAANAGYYAEIVAERAVLRRLVEAGTRIVQMGYAQGEGDIEDVVNRAQAAVYDVTDRRGGEDYVVLADLLEPTLNEIEVASGRTDEMIGVPTGFTDLDELTHGLHPGQMIVVAARPAVGKALALDTPLATPTGWTSMGEVAVGDQLLGADGRPTTVVAATEVMGDRPCYEVEFSDGTVIVADGEHQWLTETRASRRSAQAARDGRNGYRNQRTFSAVRTTEQIAATVRTRTAEARLNHSVILTQPLELPAADLPLTPYLLGAWLGDGTSRAAQITTADDEMVMLLEGEGYAVRPTSAWMRYSVTLPCESPRCQACRNDHGTVTSLLRSLGVLGHKHIPLSYQRSSERQRRALLAGLLDTDGTVTASGCVQFCATDERLAMDVRELVVGLGYRCMVARKRAAGRTEATSTAYTLTFSADEDVFRLTRKATLHKERRVRGVHRRGSLFIREVRAIESVPVRCVEVDSADHLYLAGHSMVPTHNSTLGIDIARSAAIKHGQTVAVFSLEMSRSEITMRIMSAEASIQLQELRKGTLGDAGWQKLARVTSEISQAPLFIDDSPNMSLMEIRAKCRRLKQLNNLRLVVIDYLQLMSSGKKVESRQQEVAEFSRALKLLAKELEVPVIAISQLNRGPEQRTDKRPQMSDLRESGCVPASTRILRADTGAETTIGELAASGERDVTVWALDDGLHYTKRTMTHAFATGTAPVFRLTLASGRTVRATENHPFLTYAGWAPLASLRGGDRVAVPRHVPSPLVETEWVDDEVVLLARLLGDGSLARHQAVATRPDGLGMPGLRPSERSVPTAVFSLPKRQIALFLRHLWATDGSVTVRRDGRGGRVSYASTSRRLVDDVSRLFLRFGITGRVRTVRGAAGGDCSILDILDVDSQRRFLQEIGVHGDGSLAADRLLDIVRGQRAAADVATVPTEVWDDVRDAMAATGVTARELQAALGTPSSGSVSYASAPSRERLTRVADVLDRADLELTAVNDVLWDHVVEVELDGIEEVFDATVLDCHNFVADGIAVHNSIEQDADVVILLHRDRTDPEREGEADVIVAKHRNGPTRDIVLAFQGHYSRFANMARDF